MSIQSIYTERPTGYLGKSWDSMTKEEILNVFFKLWDEKEKIQRELDSYARVITNKQEYYVTQIKSQ